MSVTKWPGGGITTKGAKYKMARPIKDGFVYFNFDVDFLLDHKIKAVRGRFGCDGLMLYIYILCLIYDKGYYIQLDDDFADIASDDLKMSTDKIGLILNFLLNKSLFDDKLFSADKVLTSRSIQRRFQAMAKSKKRDVEVNKNFWILEKSETESFIKVTHFRDLSEKNTDKSEKNDTNKNKVNKIKINKNKIKDNIGTDKPSRKRTVFKKPTVEEIFEYCRERGNTVDPEHFYDYYESKGWTVGKQPMKDWKACVRNWERNGYDVKRVNTPQKKQTSNPYFELLREMEQNERKDDVYDE
jgi:hypothetical protein